jgi:hypothetical protein
MLAAMLKFMFIYNQFMMLDNKSFRKCVCVFEATLTRSKINWGFVYLCIRSKDFVPISTISDYIHWAALAVWFFVFFITSMKSGMFENLLHSYFFFIQYTCITLKYNYTQYQRFKLIWNVFVNWFYCRYLRYNNITSIKSDTFNNLTNLHRL